MLIDVQLSELKTVSGKILLRDFCMQVKAGQMTCIEGPNGIGKSTILKAVVGLHSAFTGAINFNLPREQIVYLPQIGQWQFYLPLMLADVVSFSSKNRAEVFSELQLKRAWNTASGGERQKAMLLKTLSITAQLYILDEPFNHLDAASRLSLSAYLNQLVAEKNVSVLMISHDTQAQGLKVDQIVQVRA